MKKKANKNSRKKVLLYCQYLFGVGHVRRSLNIAKELAFNYDVDILLGGPETFSRENYSGVNKVALTPLLGDIHTNQPYCPSEESVSTIFTTRSKEISEQIVQNSYEALVVEKFPFGRKFFRPEIVALIRRFKKYNAGKKVLCSIPDFIEPKGSKRANQIAFDLSQYFDGILVHGDERVMKITESAPYIKRFSGEISYTGYVVREFNKRSNQIKKTNLIISSVGGSEAGEKFLKKILPIAKCMSNFLFEFYIPKSLEKIGLDYESDLTNIKFENFGPQYHDRLRVASLSIGFGGYNSVLEILSLGIPQIIVPYEEIVEQRYRAERLSEITPIEVIPVDQLSLERIEMALESLKERKAKGPSVNFFEGAARSLEFVKKITSLS